MGKRMITSKEFALRLGRNYHAVAKWLKAGKVPGAEMVDTPRGAVWMIPETAVKTFTPPVMGRPKTSNGAGPSKETGKAQSKRSKKAGMRP
jgi:hypothetical protein